mgnify:CR=1 FL=1
MYITKNIKYGVPNVHAFWVELFAGMETLYEEIPVASG